MKKNKIIYMFLMCIICFFCILISVSAEKYTCVYEYDQVSTSSQEAKKGQLYVDEKNKKITAEGGFLSSDYILLDPEIDPEWTEEKLIDDYIKGKCPSELYLCKVQYDWVSGSGNNSTTNYIYYPLINIDLETKITKTKLSNSTDEGNGGHTYYLLEEPCFAAILVEDESDREKIELDLGCSLYDELYKSLDSKYCSGSDCRTTQINEYKEEKEKLTSYCSKKLEFSSSFDPCVKKCLNLKTEIETLEGKSSSDNSSCGFSKRLLSFFANILRWVKYILPAIVIVLGILDFIKAIGADKEDEIKKAQQRFIKRLIAAALVFLVPLILEFVLDKMGFSYDSCGLF